MLITLPPHQSHSQVVHNNLCCRWITGIFIQATSELGCWHECDKTIMHPSVVHEWSDDDGEVVGWRKTHFLFDNRFIYFLLCCYSGEATADELLSRLQHVKEGQEQQNTAPSNDRGEEPIGKIVSFAITVVFQTWILTVIISPRTNWKRWGFCQSLGLAEHSQAAGQHNQNWPPRKPIMASREPHEP